MAREPDSEHGPQAGRALRLRLAAPAARPPRPGATGHGNQVQFTLSAAAMANSVELKDKSTMTQ